MNDNLFIYELWQIPGNSVCYITVSIEEDGERILITVYRFYNLKVCCDECLLQQEEEWKYPYERTKYSPDLLKTLSVGDLLASSNISCIDLIRSNPHLFI